MLNFIHRTLSLTTHFVESMQQDLHSVFIKCNADEDEEADVVEDGTHNNVIAKNAFCPMHRLKIINITNFLFKYGIQLAIFYVVSMFFLIFISQTSLFDIPDISF